MCSIDARNSPRPDDTIVSCVTGWAEVRQDSPDASQVVRLDLVAELMGRQESIASAFVTPGFRGVWVSAAGIIGDAFHARARSSNYRTVFDVALAGAAGCCAEPRVRVPRSLQQVGAELPAGLLTPTVAPLQGVDGSTRLVALVAPAAGARAVVQVGERLVFYRVRGGAAAATYTIAIGPDAGATTVAVAANETTETYLGANRGGPIIMTGWTNVAHAELWIVS